MTVFAPTALSAFNMATLENINCAKNTY